jgi:glycosyltransferase involved in cell wall biosynthesis
VARSLDEQLRRAEVTLRILHVISGLTTGGAERQLIVLSQDLVRRGHAVLIYTLNHKVPRLRELEGSGVQVIVDQKRFRLDPLVLARLRRAARSWRAEVAHGWLYDGNLYARIALRGLGIPVIISERSDNYRLSLAQRLGYTLTRGWETALVANSHAGLAFAARLHGTPPDRSHVVWNGIDLGAADREAAAAPALRAALWPGQDVSIACLVGTVTPPKDYVLALETAAALRDKDPRWRILFVGDLSRDPAAYREAVLERFRGLHLANVCRFTHERRDAIAHIAASDVLYSTSLFEGFPNAVLEAMACGTPVVSTEYSDIRRVLPLPWQTVRERNPELLADAIQRAARERSAISTAQRAWVERHATAERSIAAMEAVYALYAPRGATRTAKPTPASWTA